MSVCFPNFKMSEQKEEEHQHNKDEEENNDNEDEEERSEGESEEEDDEDDEDDYDDDEIEGSDDDDDIKVSLDENITQTAAVEAAKRRYSTQAHYTPTGNYAAMITPTEIFSSGNRIPWELVNPMGVHPSDPTKSIFSYDLSSLPNTVEAKPWTAPDADISDWFNYGFNEQTWEKYRKKILKVIKNKKYESKISVLTEQTSKR